MRITAVHERSIPLHGAIANAVVDFSRHTVSLVVLVSDRIRNGRPLCGVAFNSIGRFAQSGILRERMVPRLLDTRPEHLLNGDGTALDPAAVARAAMRDEKPGGHGDRAGAVAALELAVWDLNAKLADEPAHLHIATALGCTEGHDGTPVYAAGGYYYPDDSVARLRDELKCYRDHGYDAFKIKIGGAPLADDLRRVDAAIEVAGAADRVAVDANGRFDRADALAWGDALQERGLRWYEEPVDPLDYGLMADLAACYPGPLATGENLFSAVDAKNLLAFGGLRPDRDVLQMDPGLAYGLTEYLQMLEHAEAAGFARSRCIPHGGHLINLHIAAALGLGACEAYPNVFHPFGGWSPPCIVRDGRVWPSDAPGFGLEQKPELAPHIAALVGS
jgi:L-alanine-DL-glutamate epimerase-like enolase superfamily enzyme